MGQIFKSANAPYIGGGNLGLLQQAIEKLFERTAHASIRRAREVLTQDYKQGCVSPFRNEAKRLAYVGARMPATYAAVHNVLKRISLKGHLLDLGAGPGTASWAALELYPNLERITLIEKSPEAISLGKVLSEDHSSFKKALWVQQDLSEPLPGADTAILSYVLGELKETSEIIASSWEAVSQLVIIEPGTPKGFELIRKARLQLIQLGASILAPCPHSFACPISKNDWCHFSARTSRTKLHRLLKEGSLGYEDEKFCYLIASKEKRGTFCSRVVRHPFKSSGFVRLTLCTNEGKLEERAISKKSKELYHQARKSEWGDLL